MVTANFRSTAGLKKAEALEILRARKAYLLCQRDSQTSTKEVRARRREQQRRNSSAAAVAQSGPRSLQVQVPIIDTPGNRQEQVIPETRPVIRQAMRPQAVRPNPTGHALELRSEAREHRRTQRHQSSPRRPRVQPEVVVHIARNQLLCME